MPSSSTDSFRSRARAIRLNLLAGVLGTAVFLLLVEGIASVLLSARSAKHGLAMKEEAHVQYDSELGWSHRPGVSLPDFYGPEASLTINEQGFRGRESYTKAVPPGRFRLIALGDSFTLGFGVDDAETYPAQMQQLCPALQTVNMGQGGYGADQDYLWYKRDGTRIDANVLLFALIAHDIYRMVSDNFIGYGKPVLRAANHALLLENVPPPSWSGHDFVEDLAVVRLGRWAVDRTVAPEAFYGAVGPETFEAAELAFDDLAAISRARGQRFVLAYLPSGDLLAKEPTREAAWLENYARRKGIAFINLVPEFNRLTPAQLAHDYRWDYHYTVEGNRLAARALLARLAAQIPGFPACPGTGTAAPAAGLRP